VSSSVKMDQRKDWPHLRTAANESCATGKGMALKLDKAIQRRTLEKTVAVKAIFGTHLDQGPR